MELIDKGRSGDPRKRVRNVFERVRSTGEQARNVAAEKLRMGVSPPPQPPPAATVHVPEAAEAIPTSAGKLVRTGGMHRNTKLAVGGAGVTAAGGGLYAYLRRRSNRQSSSVRTTT